MVKSASNVVKGEPERLVDVIIVGYGAAGTTAAITAHDLGAEILVLEKMPIGGGNTITSGGHFICPEDSDSFIEFFSELSRDHEIEPEVLQVFAERMVGNVEWLEGIGGDDVNIVKCAIPGHSRMSEYPTFPGADRVHTYTLKVSEGQGRGQKLFEVLDKAASSRGIEVLYNSPVSRLVTNDTGEVTGVIAEIEGKPALLGARKAVILTCGGFENDHEMISNFLGYTWDQVRFSGTPANTGDGIRMAQRVGAALWHMTGTSGPFLGTIIPGHLNAMNGLPLAGMGFIMVNRYGKRFGTESKDAVADVPPYFTDARESMHGKGMEHIFLCDYMHPGRVDYPNLPCYAIFDDETRANTKHRGRERLIFPGPLSPPVPYRWSEGLTKEMDSGVVVSGNDPGELAENLGIDPAGLTETIKTYNDYCSKGKDEEYYRKSETLVPIKKPPFHAIELVPSLNCTRGGPKRDGKCRILYPDGSHIPGLYEAGELGSIFGFLYNAGGNFAECFVAGQISAENAVAEKPRE